MKSKNQAVKTKEFQLEVKLDSGDAPGTIEGYVSKFNVVDSYNEKVMPGAFGNSLNLHKRKGTYPLMLWQHDTREPIGVWDDFSDDGAGLYGKGRLLIKQDVPQADKAYSLLKAGAVWGQSIGYREIDVTPGQGGDPTLLNELHLMESSIVSFAANEQAYVSGVKSGSEQAAIERWERLQELARKFRDGEPAAVKEYEEVLREAGFPRSVATQIASVGYVKSIQSDSGGTKATTEVLDRLTAALASFR